MNYELNKHTETASLRAVLEILTRKLTFGYKWSGRMKNSISDAEM